MAKEHFYTTTIQWTGNRGTGTSEYRAYGRDHFLQIEGKPVVPCSSDPVFRGDPTRYNPEELLVAALSACHMLWYLHLCAEQGIVVKEYTDTAIGSMKETENGSGKFTGVVLQPRIKIAAGDVKIAQGLHEHATKMCFIANSVNFPVSHEATVELESATH
jgi:organic hydroperoxide reductase OsmC/OhrA